MTSIGTMIKRIAGLHGTNDVTAWEAGFISGIVSKTNNGGATTCLTEKQVEIIERIHGKHFAS